MGCVTIIFASVSLPEFTLCETAGQSVLPVSGPVRDLRVKPQVRAYKFYTPSDPEYDDLIQIRLLLICQSRFQQFDCSAAWQCRRSDKIITRDGVRHIGRSLDKPARSSTLRVRDRLR